MNFRKHRQSDRNVRQSARTTVSSALSPHDRFTIALHSSDGVDETGMLRCAAEKMAETPAGIRGGPFSLVRFESKSPRIAAVYRNFQDNPGRFICGSDCMVALPGIEPGFED
jgi:hypothetical protein